MSEQPDMIPRVTVRDNDDAIFIVMAIRTHMNALLHENLEAARRPGADTWALSLASNEQTKYAVKLMEDITCGIVDTSTTPDNTTED